MYDFKKEDYSLVVCAGVRESADCRILQALPMLTSSVLSYRV